MLRLRGGLFVLYCITSAMEFSIAKRVFEKSFFTQSSFKLCPPCPPNLASDPAPTTGARERASRGESDSKSPKLGGFRGL